MNTILEDLPNLGELDDFLTDKLKSATQWTDSLEKIDTEVSQRITRQMPRNLTGGLIVPQIPASLSKKGLMAQLSQPLSQIKSINGDFLIKEITPLPIKLDTPNFDINAVMSGITLPSFSLNIPGLSEVTAPLSQINNAVAATPMRLLNIILKVLDSLVNVQPDKLIELSQTALAEIYKHQIETLQDRLPLVALQTMIKILQEEAFLDKYQIILGELEILSENDDIKPLLADAQESLLPQLRRIEQATISLESLNVGDMTAITDALNAVVDVTNADEVFLKKSFDAVENQTAQLLEKLTPPLKQLEQMAGDIKTYLSQTADRAQETAQLVSEKIESHISGVDGVLKEIEARLKEIEPEINQFLDKLNVSSSVNQIKAGCNQIGDGVVQFFSEIDALEKQLEKTVKHVEVQVDQEMSPAFNDIEQKIREMLTQITGVLSREDVKEALNKAKQGIEQFNSTIDEASLKPVFDMVLDKTEGLESSIKSIDVARLGTPQKTALKIGAKLIQEVKIDDIIKPELISAFQEIRDPLKELIELLEEQVLEIETSINAFNPGSLATDKILNADFYKTLMSTLAAFQPSKLLAPLKKANAKLSDLVNELDPQKLIDELQRIYGQFSELVDALSPAHLERPIREAIDIVVFQLKQVRDQELDKIVTTIKENVSIEKLMAGTGIQDIAKAEFWQSLNKVLGGAHLDSLKEAMAEVESQFQNSTALNFDEAMMQLTKAVIDIENQISVETSVINQRLMRLKQLLEDGNERVKSLQQRRRKLLVRYQDYPEVNDLLKSMDMTAFRDMIKAVRGLDQNALDSALGVLKIELGSQLNALENLTERQLQQAVPTIFHKQIAKPIGQLVDNLQAKLQAFSQSVGAIEDILITLTALPGRIDQSVGIDSLRNNIRITINNTVSTIETFQASLTTTLKGISDKVNEVVIDLSPYWMLNAFAEGDFTEQGLLKFATRISEPGSDVIAVLLQTKLSSNEREVLSREGHSNNVIKALNGVLRDNKLCSSQNYNRIKAELYKKINELDDALIYQALHKQLQHAWIIYNHGRYNKNAMIRLNRLILEAGYLDDIKMSLQSLHLYIREQISQLYPEQKVRELDNSYQEILDKVKQLPDQMIRAPLDEDFQKIKATLKENFDIASVFNGLNIKLEEMDDDLSEGLTRLSAAYRQLLITFEQRL
ncbi:MAG: hypothetical protein ABFS56_27510 [Pseudomonadota bacterium]